MEKEQSNRACTFAFACVRVLCDDSDVADAIHTVEDGVKSRIMTGSPSHEIPNPVYSRLETSGRGEGSVSGGPFEVEIDPDKDKSNKKR